MVREPIPRRKLYQEVIDRLVAAISTAEFPPGSQLPSERELMLQYGVGRPAIREAMLSLQQMGLIRISHGERARVVNPTADTIIDQISNAMVMMLAINPNGLDNLKEARLLLETGLVRLATRRATAENLKQLAQSQRDLRDARGDEARFIACDMAFHVAIADISGNQIIGAVVRGMLAWLSRFKVDMVSIKGAERMTVDEHERIARAIAGGDGDGAAAAMTEHLTRAKTLYAQLASAEA